MSARDRSDLSAPEKTPLELRVRLCVMMFLQYFVQGCYLPIASVYLRDNLGFSGREIGLFGSAIAVGPLLAPFVLGQLVDRYFSTQRVMACCHLGSGVLMIALYLQTGVWPVIVLGTIYSILYVPTMMLSNALAFHHLKDHGREFPLIRLWGTIGFVVPAWLIELYWLQGLTGDELNSARGIAFACSGVAGLVMGVYCLTLPHTPPKADVQRKFAPGAVLGMLRMRPFFVLALISFFVAMAHQFFFVWNSPFLRDILDSGGWQGAYEQRISSIGQICEVGVMAMLGLMITRLGFKRTMLLGICAYTVRCLLFALVFGLGLPFEGMLTLACIGQALHGFCFGCFIAVAYMYVDRLASSDLRGSMQTMYGTLVLGLGFVCGGVFAGWVGELFTTSGAEPSYDWTNIWLSCAALAAACAIPFAIFFPRSVPEDNPEGVSAQ